MIELIVADRCTGCGTCAEVCPTDVFDWDAAAGQPVIARQEECHTCFLCEAHCPADALYVGPLRTPQTVSLDSVLASGVLGNFRRALGFDQHEPGSFCYGEPVIRTGLAEAEGTMKQDPNGPNAGIYAALAIAAQRGLVDVTSRDLIPLEVRL